MDDSGESHGAVGMRGESRLALGRRWAMVGIRALGARYEGRTNSPTPDPGRCISHHRSLRIRMMGSPRGHEGRVRAVAVRVIRRWRTQSCASPFVCSSFGRTGPRGSGSRAPSRPPDWALTSGQPERDVTRATKGTVAGTNLNEPPDVTADDRRPRDEQVRQGSANH